MLFLTSIYFTCLVIIVHSCLVAQQHDQEHDTPNEAAPPLVRENVREHRPTLADVGAVRCDGGGHGIVPSDADAEDDTEDGKVDQAVVGGEGSCKFKRKNRADDQLQPRYISFLVRTSRNCDRHDSSEDDEHQLLAV